MKKGMILGLAVWITLSLAACTSDSQIKEAQTNSDADTVIEAKIDEIIEEEKEEITETEKHVVIDFSNVKEFHAEGEKVNPFEFKIDEETPNDIDWVNEWYEKEGLYLPMIGGNWDHFYDDDYEYQWMGDVLEISDRKTARLLYVLEYPSDKWYVNGNNAYLKDGVFYGGCVANGYAQPDSCFMFAYDLNNDELLWRSADQTYNTMNFIVKDDVIICGYGFTAEKDYLYQLNRYTGDVIDKFELRKMPDLLVENDGKLYVHTYSYDYVIDIE